MVSHTDHSTVHDSSAAEGLARQATAGITKYARNRSICLPHLLLEVKTCSFKHIMAGWMIRWIFFRQEKCLVETGPLDALARDVLIHFQAGSQIILAAHTRDKAHNVTPHTVPDLRLRTTNQSPRRQGMRTRTPGRPSNRPD